LALLVLLEFETIFSAMGLCLQTSGATILPTLTIPRNIMKITIATNPALENFLAYEILSSNAKKEETAKRPTIGTDTLHLLHYWRCCCWYCWSLKITD
jgi:hypothetical protein